MPYYLPIPGEIRYGFMPFLKKKGKKVRFYLAVLFNGISTPVGYSMPNLSGEYDL